MKVYKVIPLVFGTICLGTIGVFGQILGLGMGGQDEKQPPYTRITGPKTLLGGSSVHSSNTAGIPRLMKFNGILHDVSDKPISGTVDVNFSLYNTEVGGDALWYETETVQADELGRYTTLLGAMHGDGLPMELFTSNQAQWLGIQVGNEAEQQPRVLLVSVPYALKAGDAETLGGKPSSAYMLAETSSGGSSGVTAGSATPRAPGGTGGNEQSSRKAKASTLTACTAVTSSGATVVNSIAYFTTACNAEGATMYQSSGKLGIGTSAPATTLDITSGSNAGLRIFGTGTHQMQMSGATSGRLGQDAQGFFLSSDTNGASIRFGTNNGTGHECMRITSAGNVGIGTTVPSNKLEVAGNLKIDGTGNALVFPDGTVMTSAGAGTNGGTITAVTAGTDLTGGGSSGGVTLNLDLTKVPQLGTSNAFKGNQSVTGNVMATGMFSGNGGGLTDIPNSALGGSARSRNIVYLAGCDSCSPLDTSDSQSIFYVNAVGAMTLTSVACFADSGSPAINIARHNGGPTSLLSSNITCDGTATTAFASASLALGDQLDFIMASPDGVAKSITLVIQTTLN